MVRDVEKVRRFFLKYNEVYFCRCEACKKEFTETSVRCDANMLPCLTDSVYCPSCNILAIAEMTGDEYDNGCCETMAKRAGEVFENREFFYVDHQGICPICKRTMEKSKPIKLKEYIKENPNVYFLYFDEDMNIRSKNISEKKSLKDLFSKKKNKVSDRYEDFHLMIKCMPAAKRLCCLFLLIEGYLNNVYKETDWAFASERMWQWTDKYWVQGCHMYSVITPEFILEAESYEKISEYDRTVLSKEEYNKLKILYDAMDKKGDFEELCRVFSLPLEFSRECEDDPLSKYSWSEEEIFDYMLNVLSAHSIKIPGFEEIKGQKI